MLNTAESGSSAKRNNTSFSNLQNIYNLFSVKLTGKRRNIVCLAFSLVFSNDFSCNLIDGFGGKEVEKENSTH